MIKGLTWLDKLRDGHVLLVVSQGSADMYWNNTPLIDVEEAWGMKQEVKKKRENFPSMNFH